MDTINLTEQINNIIEKYIKSTIKNDDYNSDLTKNFENNKSINEEIDSIFNKDLTPYEKYMSYFVLPSKFNLQEWEKRIICNSLQKDVNSKNLINIIYKHIVYMSYLLVHNNLSYSYANFIKYYTNNFIYDIFSGIYYENEVNGKEIYKKIEYAKQHCLVCLENIFKEKTKKVNLNTFENLLAKNGYIDNNEKIISNKEKTITKTNKSNLNDLINNLLEKNSLSSDVYKVNIIKDTDNEKKFTITSNDKNKKSTFAYTYINY